LNGLDLILSPFPMKLLGIAKISLLNHFLDWHTINILMNKKGAHRAIGKHSLDHARWRRMINTEVVDVYIWFLILWSFR